MWPRMAVSASCTSTNLDEILTLAESTPSLDEPEYPLSSVLPGLRSDSSIAALLTYQIFFPAGVTGSDLLGISTQICKEMRK